MSWWLSCDARPGHDCPEGVLWRAATAAGGLLEAVLYSLELCECVAVLPVLHKGLVRIIVLVFPLDFTISQRTLM